MKKLITPNGILVFVFLIPLFYSCEKEAEEFANSEPVTYYLSYEEALSTSSASDGSWLYITNYVYSSGLTTCEWTVHLNHNITKDEFGYNLIFWSEKAASITVEFILKEDDIETVLLTKEMSIPFQGETVAVSHTSDIETAPQIGINPKSGKDGDLILRMTHLSGTEAIEILYDGDPGTIGCASITVFGDL